jgi:stage V sporulation protein G
MVDVTQVKVVPIRGEGATRAMASVTLSESFVVHGLRVVESEKGLFMAMPQRKDAEGNYRDVAHPITPEARAVVSSLVLEEYQHDGAGRTPEGGTGQGATACSSERPRPPSGDRGRFCRWVGVQASGVEAYILKRR